MQCAGHEAYRTSLLVLTSLATACHNSPPPHTLQVPSLHTLFSRLHALAADEYAALTLFKMADRWGWGGQVAVGTCTSFLLCCNIMAAPDRVISDV